MKVNFSWVFVGLGEIIELGEEVQAVQLFVIKLWGLK